MIVILNFYINYRNIKMLQVSNGAATTLNPSHLHNSSLEKENPRFKPLKGRYVNTPFRVEEDLELNGETTGEKCLKAFLTKGGELHHLDPNKVKASDRFVLLSGDIVYPSCSGGFNRSQTLWSILFKYNTSISLLLPHATRLGFDPYNDKVNWHKNTEKEQEADEFELWFQHKKVARFGYEKFKELAEEKNPPNEKLSEIKKYYSENYFGPVSIPEGKSRNRRVYITFAQNAHAIIHRLNQSNADLRNVLVVSVDLDDYVDKPLDKVKGKSQAAYAAFEKILRDLIDFSRLA